MAVNGDVLSSALQDWDSLPPEIAETQSSEGLKKMHGHYKGCGYLQGYLIGDNQAEGI